MFFPQFKPTSKVWVYASNRVLSEEEQNFITQELKVFIPGWAAHGNELFGDAMLHADRFLILAVDESIVPASGCSIDTSVKFIKELGSTLKVDFFDRLNLIIEKEGALDRVHISELKNYLSWRVYNPMVSNLDELRNNWLIPVDSSPFV